MNLHQRCGVASSTLGSWLGCCVNRMVRWCLACLDKGGAPNWRVVWPAMGIGPLCLRMAMGFGHCHAVRSSSVLPAVRIALRLHLRRARSASVSENGFDAVPLRLLSELLASVSAPHPVAGWRLSCSFVDLSRPVMGCLAAVCQGR